MYGERRRVRLQAVQWGRQVIPRAYSFRIQLISTRLRELAFRLTANSLESESLDSWVTGLGLQFVHLFERVRQ